MDFSHLEHQAKTDQGRKRKLNEDSLVVCPEHGVFCVCDGMGGAEGGEIASEKAVKAIAAEFRVLKDPRDAASCERKGKLVQRGINKASRWIHEFATARDTRGMGTTAVIIAFDALRPDRAMVLHAGDSRAYRFRGGDLFQISRDHSLAEATGVEDEESMAPQFRGVVTRAVGIEASVVLDRTPVDVREGDVFMLCSDGLTKMARDDKIKRILTEKSAGDLAACGSALIDAANAAGGKDNITAVLIRVGKAAPRGDWVKSYVETEADTTDTDVTDHPDKEADTDEIHPAAPPVAASVAAPAVAPAAPAVKAVEPPAQVVPPPRTPAPAPTLPAAKPREAGRRGPPVAAIAGVALVVLAVVAIGVFLAMRRGGAGKPTPPVKGGQPPPGQVRAAVEARVEEALQNGDWGGVRRFLEESIARIDAELARPGATLPTLLAGWERLGGDAEKKAALLGDETRRRHYEEWLAEWDARRAAAGDPSAWTAEYRARLEAILPGAVGGAVEAPAGADADQRASAFCAQRRRDEDAFLRALGQFAEARRATFAPLWEREGAIERLWLISRSNDRAAMDTAGKLGLTLNAQIAAIAGWREAAQRRPFADAALAPLADAVAMSRRAGDQLIGLVAARIADIQGPIEIARAWNDPAMSTDIDQLAAACAIVAAGGVSGTFDEAGDSARAVADALAALNRVAERLLAKRGAMSGEDACLFLAMNPDDGEALARLQQAEQEAFIPSADGETTLEQLTAAASFLAQLPRHGVVAARTRSLAEAVEARAQAVMREYALPEALDLERARLLGAGIPPLRDAWNPVWKRLEEAKGDWAGLTPEAVQPGKVAFAWGRESEADPWLAYRDGLAALRQAAPGGARPLPKGVSPEAYARAWDAVMVPKSRLEVSAEGVHGPDWPRCVLVDPQPDVAILLPGGAAQAGKPVVVEKKWGDTLAYEATRGNQRKETKELKLTPPDGVARLCGLGTIDWARAAADRDAWWPFLADACRAEYDKLLRDKAQAAAGAALANPDEGIRKVSPAFAPAGLDGARLVAMLQAWDRLAPLKPAADAFEIVPDTLRVRLKDGRAADKALAFDGWDWRAARDLHAAMAQALDEPTLKAVEAVLRREAKGDLERAMTTGEDTRGLLQAAPLADAWTGFGTLTNASPLVDGAAGVRRLDVLVKVDARDAVRKGVSYTVDVDRPDITRNVREFWQVLERLPPEARGAVEPAAWAVVEGMLLKRLDSAQGLMKKELAKVPARRAQLGQDCLALAHDVEDVTGRVSKAGADSALGRRLLALFDAAHFAPGMAPKDGPEAAFVQGIPWLAAAAQAAANVQAGQ